MLAPATGTNKRRIPPEMCCLRGDPPLRWLLVLGSRAPFVYARASLAREPAPAPWGAFGGCMTSAMTALTTMIPAIM